MLDEALLTKLLCVGFIAAFMLPFGVSCSPMSAMNCQELNFRR
jgi:hypothetical protein